MVVLDLTQRAAWPTVSGWAGLRPATKPGSEVESEEGRRERPEGNSTRHYAYGQNPNTY